MEKENNDILRISIFNAFTKGLLNAIVFFLGIYLKKIGFSGTEIGIIFMIYSFTGLFSILPSGFSNDIFKSKHMVTIALLLLAIQYLGIANFTTFPIILIFFLLGSIGKTLYANSIDSLFLKATEKEHTKKKISTFLSLTYIFTGSSIILAGYFLNIDISFGKIFTIIGLLFATMAILSQFILPKSATAKFEILHYKKDILRGDVLFFLLIMFLFSLHYGAEETSYGLFLENTLKLNKLESGLYMGIAILSMAISVIIIRKVLKTVEVKNILLFGTLVSGLGLMLMTIQNPAISLLFRIIHETGDATMFFFLYYGITKLFDLERIGGNTGVVTFVTIIGAATSNLLFGPIGSKFGYNIPFLIGGLTSILAFFLALKFRHVIKH
ncbi:MAG: MFS transporter [Candidatus Gracilibacteria bacterium]